MSYLYEQVGEGQCPFVECAYTRRIRSIWHYLHEHGPQIALVMAGDLGVTQCTITQSLTRWRRRCPGIFRITSWEQRRYEDNARTGGFKPAPVWALGNLPDAKRPPPLTKRQRYERWYARNKITHRIKVTLRNKERQVHTTTRPATWLTGLK